MAGFWAGVPLNEIATVGSYRFTFRNVGGIATVPNMVLPFEFNIDNKRVRMNAAAISEDGAYFTVQIDVLQNPIPIMVMMYGIMAILGIAGAVLVLDRVEKLITDPVSGILIYVAAAIALIIVYRSLSK